MKSIMKNTIAFLLLSIWGLNVQAQCVNWNTIPQKEEAEDEHVIYRDAMKKKDYDFAFEHWQKAYKLAPAANGKSGSHYTDGRTLYMEKFKAEKDEAKKKEYMNTILRLYKEHMACYEKDKPMLLGREAYDMFYSFRTPYSEILKVVKEAVDLGGNKSEYVVFTPYATIVTYLFQKKKMTKEEAREVYTKLNKIADYNIENNKQFSTYYKQAKDAMNAEFAKIESYIFDCEYFKKKLEPEYRSSPDDWEVVKRVYNKLVAQGCEAVDPLVTELKQKYDVLVANENAKRLDEFYSSNPGSLAKKLYDEGKYSDAINQYKTAIAGTSDPEQQASYYFSIASIQFRKLKNASSARANARKAASLKSGWGKPYMLIGDMYAASSKKCGSTPFDHQVAVLAAIDKYNYAKSIDPSVAAEANKKIGRYQKFKPAQDTAFMMGLKKGQQVKVKCWIGETVKLRFQ